MGWRTGSQGRVVAGVEGPEKRQGREGLPEESHAWGPGETPVSGSGVGPWQPEAPALGGLSILLVPTGPWPLLCVCLLPKIFGLQRPLSHAPAPCPAVIPGGGGREGQRPGPGASSQPCERQAAAEAMVEGSRQAVGGGGRNAPENGGMRGGLWGVADRTASLAFGQGLKLTQYLPRTGLSWTQGTAGGGEGRREDWGIPGESRRRATSWPSASAQSSARRGPQCRARVWWLHRLRIIHSLCRTRVTEANPCGGC